MGATGRIAAMEPHPKRRKHVKLIIDGREDLVVHEDVVVALGLNIGALVTDQVLIELSHEKEISRAHEAAARLLKYRSRSRQELDSSLRQKGFADAVVEKVLAKLENLGLLDDALFARDLARSLLRRQFGRQGLLYRLRQSGIGDEVAREAVDEVLEGVDDTERARQALEKRMSRWGKLDAMQKRAKAYQYLARLGFGADTISDALRSALAGDTDF